MVEFVRSEGLFRESGDLGAASSGSAAAGDEAAWQNIAPTGRVVVHWKRIASGEAPSLGYSLEARLLAAKTVGLHKHVPTLIANAANIWALFAEPFESRMSGADARKSRQPTAAHADVIRGSRSAKLRATTRLIAVGLLRDAAQAHGADCAFL